jgi:hypothetical protein
MTAPLSADDRLAILELLARYARAMDDGDVEAFIGCFISEPELDILGKRVTGSAELRLFVEDYCGWPGRPGWQHHINAVIFDGDSQRCHVKSYVMWITRGPDGEMTLRGCSNYADDCVRTAEGWRFARHVAHH